MNQFQIRTLEDAGRTTAVWNSDSFDHQPRYADVFIALLPASLILLATAVLLVALL
ncbi:hypothetical protein O9Z70_10655 [Devosia sp. YIM 151766]|uniref:hypothetical protein n=1 Tax=Devosia sp. YIM 151766 TaxID=3017325 RepID=UPI00255CE7D2|nr:hypothetical protein [Devosia sp. YIM 151766]WIY51940.1 hypothetical protein O9Z70_10655 [Devosia sp. YIM 151766]